MTPTRAPHVTPSRHTVSTAAWTVAVPLLVLLVVGAVLLSWRDELPDRVATHWGPGGEADGWTSLDGLLGGLAGGLLVAGLALALIGRRNASHVATRRLVNGLAAGLAIFLGGLAVGLTTGQRGLEDAANAQPSDLAITAGLLAAVTVGVLAARLTPTDPTAPAAPLPPDAATLPLGAGESAAWVGAVGVRSPLPLVAASLASGALIGAVSDLWTFAAVLSVLLAGLLVVTLSWQVTIDRRGLTARSRLRRPVLHIPVDEVEQARVRDVNPLRDFGGWGLRTGLDGSTGLVLRRGPALEVQRSGGRRFTVTLDDPADAAALLNTFAARRG